MDSKPQGLKTASFLRFIVGLKAHASTVFQAFRIVYAKARPLPTYWRLFELFAPGLDLFPLIGYSSDVRINPHAFL